MYIGIYTYGSLENRNFNLDDPLHVQGYKFYTEVERPFLNFFRDIVLRVSPYLTPEEKSDVKEELTNDLSTTASTSPSVGLGISTCLTVQKINANGTAEPPSSDC